MARVLVATTNPSSAGSSPRCWSWTATTWSAPAAAGGARPASRRAPFDVVVTDLRMPEVDGLAVLRAARARVPAAGGRAHDGLRHRRERGRGDEGRGRRLRHEAVLDGRAPPARRAARRAARRGGAEPAAPRAAHARPRRGERRDEGGARRGAPGRRHRRDACCCSARAAPGRASSRATSTTERAAPRGPLVEVHCAALPETLLESELFGHEKGAFTGATQRKAGHLAAADGGTLFLDEIGEISPATQVKLLRFLQERDASSRWAPPRSGAWTSGVVSATNRDLEAAVRAGAFREDFYYRLNVFAIRVPPAPRAAARTSSRSRSASSPRRARPRGEALGRRARERLLAHAWPGNVRELENALERALILAGDGEVRRRPPRAAGRPAAAGAAPSTRCSSRGSTSTPSSARSSSPPSSGRAGTRRRPRSCSASPAGGCTRCSRASAPRRVTSPEGSCRGSCCSSKLTSGAGPARPLDRSTVSSVLSQPWKRTLSAPTPASRASARGRGASARSSA